MKLKNKIISVLVLVILVSFAFVGCAHKPSVKKASKNLTAYSIEATLCDEEKKLTAIEKVDYLNSTQTTFSYVDFILYGKAFSENAKVKPYSKQKLLDCFPNGVNYGDMIIGCVMIGGVNAQYELVGEDLNVLRVNLLEELFPNERVEITIEFELWLTNSTHRLGYNDNTINLGNWYPVAAIYEKGDFATNPYYSNGDPFYSECANYKVSISYNNKYTLASTGDKIKTDNNGDVTTDYFEAKAVRDFAMCLATDYQVVNSVVDDVNISVYAYKTDEKINDYLQTAINAMTLFNDLYGMYPYKSLSVAFTDFFQGGMEYPGLVYISDSVEDILEIKKVIVHEIAHEWWYGVVGNNEVKDAWFDEGLAEYSTLLYFDKFQEGGITRDKLIGDAKINYELYLDVVTSLNLGVNYAMNLNLGEYTSEYEYVYMIYVKGLLFFDDIRNKLGDEVFFKFLKRIYREYAFKIINKENFIALLEDVSKLDVAPLVEGWLSGSVDALQN